MGGRGDWGGHVIMLITGGGNAIMRRRRSRGLSPKRKLNFGRRPGRKQRGAGSRAAAAVSIGPQMALSASPCLISEAAIPRIAIPQLLLGASFLLRAHNHTVNFIHSFCHYVVSLFVVNRLCAT